MTELPDCFVNIVCGKSGDLSSNVTNVCGSRIPAKELLKDGIDAKQKWMKIHEDPFVIHTNSALFAAHLLLRVALVPLKSDTEIGQIPVWQPRYVRTSCGCMYTSVVIYRRTQTPFWDCQLPQPHLFLTSRFLCAGKNKTQSTITPHDTLSFSKRWHSS